jgi:uncharacterized repeat protein (TIGR03803 family)
MKNFQRITITLPALIFLFISAGFSQTVSTIHSFSGGSDGEFPYLGGLTQGRNGALYGVTLLGGASNLGTVFEISPAGVEMVIYNFDGTHGSEPPVRVAPCDRRVSVWND